MYNLFPRTLYTLAQLIKSKMAKLINFIQARASIFLLDTATRLSAPWHCLFACTQKHKVLALIYDSSEMRAIKGEAPSSSASVSVVQCCSVLANCQPDWLIGNLKSNWKTDWFPSLLFSRISELATRGIKYNNNNSKHTGEKVMLMPARW